MLFSTKLPFSLELFIYLGYEIFVIFCKNFLSIMALLLMVFFMMQKFCSLFHF